MIIGNVGVDGRPFEVGSGKVKALFICSHNAARSQLAEGLMRHLYGDRFDVHSAGIEPLGVHPAVHTVLKEVGIDASKQWSKGLERYEREDFDYVVTLCEGAHERCSFFPGRDIIPRPFRDPVITREPGEDVLTAFRAVRDEIKAWLVETFGP